MKLQKYISKLLDVLIAFVLLLFFASFGFRGGRISGWYQQFLTNLNGRNITDVYFLDSLMGWGITNATNQNNDTTYVLKTTNGGDNWMIQYRKIQIGGGFPGYFRVYFLNQTTGFVCGVTGIDKTTNGGSNWISLNAPENSYTDMSILNENTIWVVCSESLLGGVFLTTNGGLNWTQQFSAGTENPNKIYMYNARIGFINNNSNGTGIRRTTDGGTSWFIVVPNEGFRDMFFIDSLKGWYAWSIDSIKKTTNGGVTWFKQLLPPSQIIGESGIGKFSFLNKDSIWAVGAIKYFVPTPTEVRGLIYISTNGGENWGYQLPNPNQININRYYFVNFVNKLNGWAYSINKGVHTVTGGDTTFYTGIQNISREVPREYKLFQNYPNPFNSRTNVKFQMLKKGFAEIKIFDITGKLVKLLLKQNLSSGEYQINFDANDLTSGIYFYSLHVNGNMIDTKKAVLLK